MINYAWLENTKEKKKRVIGLMVFIFIMQHVYDRTVLMGTSIVRKDEFLFFSYSFLRVG